MYGDILALECGFFAVLHGVFLWACALLIVPARYRLVLALALVGYTFGRVCGPLLLFLFAVALGVALALPLSQRSTWKACRCAYSRFHCRPPRLRGYVACILCHLPPRSPSWSTYPGPVERKKVEWHGSFQRFDHSRVHRTPGAARGENLVFGGKTEGVFYLLRRNFFVALYAPRAGCAEG